MQRVIKQEEKQVRRRAKLRETSIQMQTPQDPEVLDVLQKINSVRQFLDGVQVRAKCTGKDNLIESKTILDKFLIIINDGETLNTPTIKLDTETTTFGTAILVKNPQAKIFTQLSDKSHEKIKLLEEELESMKVVVDSLRAAKPGYSCLNKKRGAVAMINQVPEKLNLKIAQIEASEKKHNIYKRLGKKQKIIEVDAPLEYKYTSPYQIFAETFEMPGKRVCFLERSFEMQSQDPSLSRKQIRQLFNKEWPKVTAEKREQFNQIADRMKSDPIKGVKGDTFNGIQAYKQLLGLPTKINPKKSKPCDIHRQIIAQEFLDELNKINEFNKSRQMIITCRFCDIKNPDEAFKGVQSQMNKHYRSKHGKRICQLCDQNFLNGKLYANHKKVRHENKMWPCDKCDLAFESSEQLETHRKNSDLMKCMHKCIKPDCNHKVVSYAGKVDHIVDKHEELFQRIQYVKNGGYQYKLSKKRSKEVETLFQKHFHFESVEDSIRELRRLSQTMVLLYDKDVLTSMALIGRRRMKSKDLLQINHLCVKKENEGSGSRLMAEIKHYANRQRYSAIIVSSIPKVVGFYSAMRFVECDFTKLLGNTYRYIVKDPLNVQMQFITPHGLRDNKCPWMWPKHFKECDAAADLRLVMKAAIEKGQPEEIDEIYYQKLYEVRGDKYQKAVDTDQAWTNPDYFKIWYKKFRLLKEWFYDPCLERRFWSSWSYFNALTEHWGPGLIFLNHAWHSTRAFYPAMLKQFWKGASILCIVTSQSCNGTTFNDFIVPLCEMEVMPPATFGGTHKKKLDRPVMAIYLFQPELLNFIAVKQAKKKMTPDEIKQTRIQKNKLQIERMNFIEDQMKQGHTRKEIESMSGVKLGGYYKFRQTQKESNHNESGMIWGQEFMQSPLRLISDDISARYHE